MENKLSWRGLSAAAFVLFILSVSLFREGSKVTVTDVFGPADEEEPADEGQGADEEEPSSKLSAELSSSGCSVLLLEPAKAALCGVPLGLQQQSKCQIEGGHNNADGNMCS